MQPLPPASGRSGRLLLLAGALVVLLAVVAFASRSGFGHSGHASTNETYVSYAFTVFLILFTLMIPVAIWAWFQRAREHGDPRNTNLVRRTLTILAFVTVASLLLWIRHWFHFHFHTPDVSGKARHGGHPGHGKLPQNPAAQETSPQFQWTVLWVAIGLGVFLLAGLFWLRKRLKPVEDTTGPTVAQDVATTISDAIDDLEREADPRRAVIAAYARMEGVLGRHGLRREPSETPLEYLRRVLLDLSTSSAAVERLTAQFERAKFSNHDVTEEMKRDAIGALAEIRDGMET